MLFRTLTHLLLAASASSTVLPRDANSILSSLRTLSSDITTLNSSLATFQGGALAIGQALQIQSQSSQLVTDTNNAASASSSSAALDDAGSRSIAFEIVTISQQTFSVLDLLISKKPAFDATLPNGGASSLVESDLQQLKNATDSLGSAVTPKLVASVQHLAPLLVADLDYHLAKAIQAYNSTA